VIRSTSAGSEPFVFQRCVLAAAVALLAACGSSSSPVAPTPPAPTPPAGSSTITIAATGFSPQELTVPVGARVTFVNSDRISHDVSSGLDHNSRDCPEIDAVGFLVAGQSRETSTFEQAKTCRFHEHDHIGVAAYQGRIVVR
jgi:plastocyanin